MIALVDSYCSTETDSSSGSGSESEEKVVSPNAEQKQTKLLPSAKDLLKAKNGIGTGEVFTNHYLEKEKAEIAKLQKHVKMVESEEHVTQKNGRKICWNNRKGRCRFGNKCKYAHESDLMVDALITNKMTVNDCRSRSSDDVVVTKKASLQLRNEEENTIKTTKTRKRNGLGDNIEPSKRVMKDYIKLKKSKT